MNKLGSLQTRLILAFNGLVLCAVGVVGGTGLWLIRGQMEEQLHRALEGTIVSARRELDAHRDALKGPVEVAASHFEVKRHLSLASHGEAREAAFLGGLLGRLAESGGLHALEVFDADGRLVARAHARETGEEGAVLVREALTGRSAAGFASGGSEALHLLSVPVTHLGEVVGVVRGGRRLDAAFVARLKERVEADVTVRIGAEPSVSTLPEGTASPMYFRELSLRAEDPPLTLAFGLSAEAVTAAGRRFQRTFLLMLAAGLLIASWLAIRLSRRITEPLQHLTEAVQQSAGGEPREAPLQKPHTRELAIYVEAYNQMVRNLQASRERLIQSERLAAWRDVARRIAHEIKNPLTPIQVSMESLRRHRDSPRFAETFDQNAGTILEEVGRLKRFVDEFAQFARLPHFVFHPTDLNALLKRIGDLHTAAFGSPQAPSGLPAAAHPLLRVEYDLGTLPPVPADAGQLEAALTNLIKNACEAMPEGGLLTLKTAADGAGVTITCRDTGPGMTPEVRARLFEPYFTTKSSGTGLGLAMVHEIIRAHRGTIEVDSGPGRGTAFTLRLPLKPHEHESD